MKHNYIKFFAAAVLAATVSPIAATIYKAEDVGTKKAMREAGATDKPCGEGVRTLIQNCC